MWSFRSRCLLSRAPVPSRKDCGGRGGGEGRGGDLAKHPPGILNIVGRKGRIGRERGLGTGENGTRKERYLATVKITFLARYTGSGAGK